MSADVERGHRVAAGRPGEVVERQRRALQLEPDRLHPCRALQPVERELRGAQRPAHLVTGARREHEPAAAAQVQRLGRQSPRQQGEPDAHAAASTTGPSTSR